jgi:hypothetical protein
MVNSTDLFVRQFSTSCVGFLEAGKRAGPLTIRTGRLLYNETIQEYNRVKGVTQATVTEAESAVVPRKPRDG